jgi:hypothetical protein
MTAEEANNLRFTAAQLIADRRCAIDREFRYPAGTRERQAMREVQDQSTYLLRGLAKIMGTTAAKLEIELFETASLIIEMEG